MEVKEEKNSLQKIIKNKKIILGIICGLIVIGLLVIFINQGNKDRLRITTKNTLEKIIEINDLSTVDYIYNAIAIKYVDDESEDVVYYVSYEGTITAGIDFNKISIEMDNKSKVVSIHLPEAEIQETRVDMGTLDYIYVGKTDENDSISQEAYQLCKKDLAEKAAKEEKILKNAKENAQSAIEALLKPWIESVDGVFTVEIN